MPPRAALPDVGDDESESMPMMAANSVDAAVHAAVDARLHLLAVDNVPESIARMAATSVDLRSCTLPELGHDAAVQAAAEVHNAAASAGAPSNASASVP